MSTERPMVTASVDWPRRTVKAQGVGIIRETPSVRIELEFRLHSHEAALSSLDAAVQEIRAQVAEVRE